MYIAEAIPTVLVGIVHFLFHPMFWYGDACFLQDLFVAEAHPDVLTLLGLEVREH